MNEAVMARVLSSNVMKNVGMMYTNPEERVRNEPFYNVFHGFIFLARRLLSINLVILCQPLFHWQVSSSGGYRHLRLPLHMLAGMTV